MENDISKALKLLTSKFKVDPVAYAPYGRALIFVAYPKGIKKIDYSKVLNPFYLVDLKNNAVGPFSVAFDLNGFDKVVPTFKAIT